jgi:hypothetical protein
MQSDAIAGSLMLFISGGTLPQKSIVIQPFALDF